MTESCRNLDVSHTLTVEHGRLPGRNFERKVLRTFSPKLIPLSIPSIPCSATAPELLLPSRTFGVPSISRTTVQNLHTVTGREHSFELCY